MDNQKKVKTKLNHQDNIIASIIYGVVIGFASILLFSLILSAVSLKFRNPINLTEGIAFACLALGGLFCGITSSLTYKKNCLISAIVSSTSIALIILLTSFNGNNSKSMLDIIINPLIIIVFGTLGGFIIHCRKNKRKTKKYIK